MDILERVKDIQKEQGFNDTQMSDLLGYKNRAGWARIKGGIVPGNKSFQMRALRAFPELASAYAQNSQDKQRGVLKSLLDKIVLKVKKFV